MDEEDGHNTKILANMEIFSDINVVFSAGGGVFRAAGIHIWFHDRLVFAACGAGGDDKECLSGAEDPVTGISGTGRREQWIFVFLLRLLKAGYCAGVSAAGGADAFYSDGIYACGLSGVCFAFLPAAACGRFERFSGILGECALFVFCLFFSDPQAGNVCQLYAVSDGCASDDKTEKIWMGLYIAETYVL